MLSKIFAFFFGGLAGKPVVLVEPKKGFFFPQTLEEFQRLVAENQKIRDQEEAVRAVLRQEVAELRVEGKPATALLREREIAPNGKTMSVSNKAIEVELHHKERETLVRQGEMIFSSGEETYDDRLGVVPQGEVKSKLTVLVERRIVRCRGRFFLAVFSSEPSVVDTGSSDPEDGRAILAQTGEYEPLKLDFVTTCYEQFRKEGELEAVAALENDA